MSSQQQYTYSRLLQHLQLSNFQFLLLITVTLIIISLLNLCYKMHSFSKVHLQSFQFPSCHIVYISFQGNYDHIKQIYQQSICDFQFVFKISNSFSITYDNPAKKKTLNDKSQNTNRAVIGIIVDKMQISKIKMFLSKFPQYKENKLPTSKCISSKYEYLNEVSSLMALSTVYPKIKLYLDETHPSQEQPSMMEIYLENQKTPTVQVLSPLENQDSFRLWYVPTDYTRVFAKKQP